MTSLIRYARRAGVGVVVASLAWAPIVAAEPPGCAEAVARGDDVECQLVIQKGKRAPYRGVLLSPRTAKLAQSDIATLEKALEEEKALTASARAERDQARLDSKTTVNDLLRTGQRLEKANASLIEANASLDASNRALGDAVEAMPTTTTLVLAGVLIAAGALGAGYGLGRLIP